MRNYQLVLALKNTLSESARKKVLETVKSWLNNAKFTKEDVWGEKPLAYAIKRQDSAFFVNFLFELKEDITKDFEKKLSDNEDILRHLLLRQK